MKFLIAVFIFCLIVVIHELGHFLFAKLNNVKVNEFSIGMGPKLFEWGKGETKYRIRLLPIGGACMMEGEDEEVEDERSFNKASVLGRISIVAAGPIFNFILAFILALLVTSIAGTNKPYILSVYENSPAKEAGLKENVLVTEYNGYKVSLGDDVYNASFFKPISKDGVEIKYIENGEEKTITMYPEYYFTEAIGTSIAIDESKDYKVLIDSVVENSPAMKAGLKEKDIIVSINGNKLSKDNSVYNYLFCDGKEKINIVYLRDGKETSVDITPDVSKATLRCGFQSNLSYEKLSGPLEVVKYSVISVKYWIVTTLRSLGMIFKGNVTINDLSGPVGIVKMIGDNYTSSVEAGVNIKEKLLNVTMTMSMMTILLSANIGVMNLVPLPALDGGRLVFLFIELITRKKVNQKIEGMVHFIGLMLLFLLMIVIMGNDLLKIFG